MERTIFDKDHDLFRSSVRDFISTEIAPFHAQWAIDGVVPRAIWTTAGALGYLCMAAPEGFGGAGVSDFRYDAIPGEDPARTPEPAARREGFGRRIPRPFSHIL